MLDADTGARGGVVVRPSSIEGLGRFATHDFVTGELIRDMVLVREVTDDAPLRPELDERIEHCAHPDGRLVLVGDPDRHLNHSCDPSAYERHRRGGIEIVARRRIATGEEVCVDYLVNNSGGDSWSCHCGAPRCRGRTGTSYFDLSDEVQAEYRGLLADWFIARHPQRFRAQR